MFMPCIPGMVWLDWSCAGAPAFWAKDEIASTATAAMYVTALRMYHSHAKRRSLWTFVSSVSWHFNFVNHKGHESTQREKCTNRCLSKSLSGGFPPRDRRV